MIKIICLTALPAAAILLYSQEVPTAEELEGAQVRAQDRAFLAELVTREATEKRLEHADHGFLTTLERNEAALPDTLPAAKAIAVQRKPVSVAEDDGVPVRRAIPVVPVAVAPPMPPAVTTTGDTRALLARPAITQITPVIRQEPAAGGRASILIYRGEVILRPSVAPQ